MNSNFKDFSAPVVRLFFFFFLLSLLLASNWDTPVSALSVLELQACPDSLRFFKVFIFMCMDILPAGICTTCLPGAP